jgi:hypothetical protein
MSASASSGRLVRTGWPFLREFPNPPTLLAGRSFTTILRKAAAAAQHEVLGTTTVGELWE